MGGPGDQPGRGRHPGARPGPAPAASCRLSVCGPPSAPVCQSAQRCVASWRTTPGEAADASVARLVAVRHPRRLPARRTCPTPTLQAQMTRGTLDSAGLTAAYLQRIDALDRQGQGPALHAIIQRNPHALDEAQQLDAERRAGHLRGSLHGIPPVLKDNIDARPMANSAGSLAVADFHPPHDAILVQRLRQARAVILGKSNLSEWANFHSSKSSSGWSARSEQTRHPYVLDRNPCGSSAGTGVAVSANLAAAGIGTGTGTDGSIVCPAAVNGLVGLKPTVGLISRDGIIPISASQDSAGPTTRSVADAATVLSVLAARDTADPAAAAAP
ncbi:amidase family protein, partial [Xanthomonas translucens]|uniref:amidase family protein n=1 Tax=Xanthomonas campestris pv. translucens TaxID=343 RepID=UPI003CCEA9BD